MTTGTVCPVTGFYRSTCPDHAKVRIVAGQVKPVCPICQKPTVWEWISEDGEERTKRKNGNGRRNGSGRKNINGQGGGSGR